jgi:hypothetical protein
MSSYAPLETPKCCVGPFQLLLVQAAVHTDQPVLAEDPEEMWHDKNSARCLQHPLHEGFTCTFSS